MNRLTADVNLSGVLTGACNGATEMCESITCANCPHHTAMINKLAEYERNGSVEVLKAVKQSIKACVSENGNLTAYIRREGSRQMPQKVCQHKLKKIAIFFRYLKHASYIDLMQIVRYKLYSFIKHK